MSCSWFYHSQQIRELWPCKVPNKHLLNHNSNIIYLNDFLKGQFLDSIFLIYIKPVACYIPFYFHGKIPHSGQQPKKFKKWDFYSLYNLSRKNGFTLLLQSLFCLIAIGPCVRVKSRLMIKVALVILRISQGKMNILEKVEDQIFSWIWYIHRISESQG